MELTPERFSDAAAKGVYFWLTESWRPYFPPLSQIIQAGVERATTKFLEEHSKEIIARITSPTGTNR